MQALALHVGYGRLEQLLLYLAMQTNCDNIPMLRNSVQEQGYSSPAHFSILIVQEVLLTYKD